MEPKDYELIKKRDFNYEITSNQSCVDERSYSNQYLLFETTINNGNDINQDLANNLIEILNEEKTKENKEFIKFIISFNNLKNGKIDFTQFYNLNKLYLEKLIETNTSLKTAYKDLQEESQKQSFFKKLVDRNEMRIAVTTISNLINSSKTEVDQLVDKKWEVEMIKNEIIEVINLFINEINDKNNTFSRTDFSTLKRSILNGLVTSTNVEVDIDENLDLDKLLHNIEYKLLSKDNQLSPKHKTFYTKKIQILKQIFETIGDENKGGFKQGQNELQNYNTLVSSLKEIQNNLTSEVDNINNEIMKIKTDLNDSINNFKLIMTTAVNTLRLKIDQRRHYSLRNDTAKLEGQNQTEDQAENQFISLAMLELDRFLGSENITVRQKSKREIFKNSTEKIDRLWEMAIGGFQVDQIFENIGSTNLSMRLKQLKHNQPEIFLQLQNKVLARILTIKVTQDLEILQQPGLLNLLKKFSKRLATREEIIFILSRISDENIGNESLSAIQKTREALEKINYPKKIDVNWVNTGLKIAGVAVALTYFSLKHFGFSI
ncbi:MAG: hypothetical protein KatS3mg090_0994 [Patescibacteria group bacterium]|nr:MAG: hypothetical protein KatS3mg090_0707 [Patescibacteria group bacterium]GIW63168.1 MAG: hypothetical protein KatS3mg090_0994 [Patescibacteria group bacterium]